VLELCMLIHNPKAGLAVLLILVPLVLAGTAAALWMIVDGAVGLIRPSRLPAKRAAGEVRDAQTETASLFSESAAGLVRTRRSSVKLPDKLLSSDFASSEPRAARIRSWFDVNASGSLR
jgi:hypothetical protein